MSSAIQLAEQAASSLAVGNHAKADEILDRLKEQLSVVDVVTLTAEVIRQDLSSAAAPTSYVLRVFFLFKLLRASMMQHMSSAPTDVPVVISFLVECVQRLPSDHLHEWRPVLSELAAAFGVALKYGCAFEVLASPLPAAVCCAGDAVLGLLPVPPLSLSGNASATPCCVLMCHLLMCQSFVEEFGLYTLPSRYRGLSVAVHRRCRITVEDSDVLGNIVERILLTLTHEESTIPESGSLVGASLQTALACLSWSSHSYFEQDTAAEEGRAAFIVKAASKWSQLLLHGVELLPGQHIPLIDVFSEWYTNRVVGRLPLSQQWELPLLECILQICSFKGTDWSDAEAYAFMTRCLTTCTTLMEAILGTPSYDASLLCPLASAVNRLLTNLIPQRLLQDSAAEPLLGRLCNVTCALIGAAASGADDDDDEYVLSSIDTLLSAWHHLSSLRVGGDGGAFPAARTPATLPCWKIFESYTRLYCSTRESDLVRPRCVANAMTHDDAGAGFGDALTRSNLRLVALLGRVSPYPSCELLYTALRELPETVILSSSSSRASLTAGQRDSMYERLWILFQLTLYLVADSAEGERPSIPECYSQGPDSSLQAVTQLFMCVRDCSAFLFEHVSSPGVIGAYISAVDGFITTYAEATDTPHNIFLCLGDEAAAAAAGFAVDCVGAALVRFPFEEDVVTPCCAVLCHISDKSEKLHGSLTQYESLWQMATDPSARFFGPMRGCMLAFLLTCCPQCISVALVQQLPLISQPPSSVDSALELSGSLVGLLESLNSQGIIQRLVPVMRGCGHNLLRFTTVNFSERQVIIDTLVLVKAIFSTCVSLVEDDEIVHILSLTSEAMMFAVDTLQTSSAWFSEDAGGDRDRYIVVIAKLLQAVAEWKSFGCFLPTEATALIGTASVRTLHFLLQCISHNLSVPEVTETVFAAYESCSDGFAVEITGASSTELFLEAIYFALQQENLGVQRSGETVCSNLVASLFSRFNRVDDSGVASTAEALASYFHLCAGFLDVLVRAVLDGKVYYSNLPQVTSCLVTVFLSTLPEIRQERFEKFSATCNEAGGRFLRSIFDAISGLHAAEGVSVGTSPTPLRKEVENAVMDSLYSLKGVYIW